MPVEVPPYERLRIKYSELEPRAAKKHTRSQLVGYGDEPDDSEWPRATLVIGASGI